MIFYFNSDGSPIGVIPERIFCGSVKANNVYFVSPVGMGNIVSVAYTLPNGDSTVKIPMEDVGKDVISGVFDSEGKEFGVWKSALPVNVTNDCGVITVQFYVSSADGSVLSTARSIFTVEEGVKAQELKEQANYDDIITCISGLNALISKANYVASASFAMDESTIKNDGQLVVGKFNIQDENAVFIAGCGSDEENRANALMITASGEIIVETQPTQSKHIVSKSYVDEEVEKISKAVVDRCGVKSIINQTSVLLDQICNKEIYCTENATTISLSPANGTEIGDKFYVMFKSGETPTGVTVNVSNIILAQEIVPKQNHVVEISGIWNGEKWVVMSNQTAVM